MNALNITRKDLLILFKEGENYNDFGDRYCPFCGLHTEAFCIAVNE